MTTQTKILASVLFLWIWGVSMLDHYLTIKLQQVIVSEEQNPVGSWLLELDGGNPALFMTVKMSLLWVVALILLCVYKWRPKVALVCLVALSIAQLFLVAMFLYTPTNFWMFDR